ncbi:MAG: MFS family permease [Halioglobus sp.]|jgi:MFS family permease
MLDKRFAKVWLLAAINAIGMSAAPLMMLIGSIVGAQLAPSEQWATLPIATMVIGTACGVIPATRAMQRFGRRNAFALFLFNGAGACVLMGHAITLENFSLFCFGSSLLGATASALQQIRFAAMECVPSEDGATAASIIMCAGILAAFIGPELALLGKNLSAVDYQGSYWLGAACLLAAACLLPFYVPAAQAKREETYSGRSAGTLLKNPTFLLAIVAGASAFMVMSFVMTATPVSMHLHHGHSLEDAKWVIQSHIAAMFLPSLFAPWLFKYLSLRAVMVAGLCCYATTIIIGLIDASVLGFWGQLVMLGIGWNFLFVSGTALLPTAYREGEQYKAQSLNDSVVFSSQAVASLCAGWAISTISWQALLLACLLPISMVVGLLLWQRQPSAPAGDPNA